MNEQRKTIGQHLDEFIAAVSQEDPARVVKTVDAPADVLPVCPNCENELSEVWRKEAPQKWKERYSFLLCPHCRKVLGTLNEVSGVYL